MLHLWLCTSHPLTNKRSMQNNLMASISNNNNTILWLQCNWTQHIINKHTKNSFEKTLEHSRAQVFRHFKSARTSQSHTRTIVKKYTLSPRAVIHYDLVIKMWRGRAWCNSFIEPKVKKKKSMFMTHFKKVWQLKAVYFFSL